MSAPELPRLLGQVRDLTAQYRAGTPESFGAFRDLVELLLGVTILSSAAGVRLTYGPRGRDRALIEGMAAPDQAVCRLKRLAIDRQGRRSV